MTKVSILMPLFNAEQVVSDAVESCIQQTWQDWELLVVDDASSDSSFEVVTSYDDARIKTVQLAQNAGPGHARNVALSMAQGSWLTVLDSDDAYCPSRLASLVKLAEAGPPTAVYFDRLASWHGLQPIVPRVACKPQDFSERAPLRVPIPVWLTDYGYAQPFFARCLVDLGIRYPSDLMLGEDTVFFLELLKASSLPAMFVDAPLYVYRQTPGSLGHTSAHRMNDRERELVVLSELFAGDAEIESAIGIRKMRLEDDRFVVELRRALKAGDLGHLARAFVSEPARIWWVLGRIMKSSWFRISRATQARKHKRLT